MIKIPKIDKKTSLELNQFNDVFKKLAIDLISNDKEYQIDQSLTYDYADSVDGWLEWHQKYIWIPSATETGKLIRPVVTPEWEKEIRRLFAYNEQERHKNYQVVFCLPKGAGKTIWAASYVLWRMDQHRWQQCGMMGPSLKVSSSSEFEALEIMAGLSPEHNEHNHPAYNYFKSRGFIKKSTTEVKNVRNGSKCVAKPCVDTSMQGKIQWHVLLLAEMGDVKDPLGIQAQQAAIGAIRAAPNSIVIATTNFPKTANTPAISMITSERSGVGVLYRTAHDVNDLHENIDQKFAPYITKESRENQQASMRTIDFERLILNKPFSGTNYIFSTDTIKLSKKDIPEFVMPEYFKKNIEPRSYSEIGISIGLDSSTSVTGADRTALIMQAKFALNPGCHNDMIRKYLDKRQDRRIKRFMDRWVLGLKLWGGIDDPNFDLRRTDDVSDTIIDWYNLYTDAGYYVAIGLERPELGNVNAKLDEVGIDYTIISPNATNQIAGIEPISDDAKLGLLNVSKEHWIMFEEMAIYGYNEKGKPSGPEKKIERDVLHNGEVFHALINDDTLSALICSELEMRHFNFGKVYAGLGVF